MLFISVKLFFMATFLLSFCYKVCTLVGGRSYVELMDTPPSLVQHTY